MDLHFQQFITNLYKFVFDINRYTPSNELKEFIDAYDKLDMNLVLLRFYSVIKDYKTLIKNKDEELFTYDLKLIPGFNLKNNWTLFKHKQKIKIWAYLNVLYTLTEMLVEYNNSTLSTSSTNLNAQNNLDFNPYFGVGTNNNFGVEQIGLQNFNEDNGEASNGLTSMLSMTGIGKMLNIDELKDQLKNMTKEDIEEATANINNMLGNNMDDNTNNLISSMLTNISQELQNDDMDSNDPLGGILKIAEKVATKMKPKMDSGEFDMDKLINSTKNLAGQIGDKDMFDGNINPFDIVNKMMNMNEHDIMKNYSDILNNFKN